MSIVYVREYFDREFDSTGISHRKLTRSWKIVVDSKDDDQQTIAVAAQLSGDLPSLYTAHPSNLYATARSLKIKNDGANWKIWFATVEYSSEPVEKAKVDRQAVPNPIDRSARIRWQSENTQEVAQFDRNGWPILNSAGDEFLADGRTIEKARWKITIQKNIFAAPAIILTYPNSVNNAAVQIQGITFPAETLKIGNMSLSERKVEPPFLYYEFVYDMLYDVDGWDLDLLDQGFHYLAADGGSGLTRRIIELNGQRPSEPVPLDGLGGILANPSPLNGVFLTFDVRTAKDFSILPGITDVS